MAEEIRKAFLKMDQLQRAEKLLQEAIGTSASPNVSRLAVIKAFELCYELGWKLMKILLEEEYDTASNNPKDTITLALRQGIIEDSVEWIKAREMRNMMTHTYDMARAEDVEEFARTRFPEMVQALLEFTKRRIRS